MLDSTGTGSMSTIIQGIDYVTQNAGQIDVANLSFGCKCTSSALDTAINNSVAAGVTFVVQQEIQEKMHPHGPLLATQTLSL